ncbi:MAG TPA: SMI1/KNR4 family protein [Ferruginibacter sp.]|jgi:hypothetical protein|nr:SMI1/KNR4 family protein [Ferruginibacter sp.]
MVTNLSNELADLVKNLEALNAPVLKLLNPPASEQILIDFFSEYFPGSPLVEDIRDIFLWHNGTIIESNIPVRKSYLFAEFLFNSIEKIQKIMDSVESTYKLKKNGFLPIFSTGHGEYLALNLKDYSNKPETTHVYYLGTWDPECDLYTTIYDSFYQMFVSVNACFKQDVYFIDDKGLIDINFTKYFEISKKMNPNSDYWRS